MVDFCLSGISNITFPVIEGVGSKKIDMKNVLSIDNISRFLNDYIDDEERPEYKEIYLKILEFYNKLTKMCKQTYESKTKIGIKDIENLENMYNNFNSDIYEYVSEDEKLKNICSFLDDSYFKRRFDILRSYLSGEYTTKEYIIELQRPIISNTVMLNNISSIKNKNIAEKIISFEKQIYYFDKMKDISYFFILKKYCEENSIAIDNKFKTNYDGEIIRCFDDVNKRFLNILDFYICTLDSDSEEYMIDMKRDIIEYEREIYKKLGSSFSNVIEELKAKNTNLLLTYKDRMLIELFKSYGSLKNIINDYNMYPLELRKLRDDIDNYVKTEVRRYIELKDADMEAVGKMFEEYNERFKIQSDKAYGSLMNYITELKNNANTFDGKSLEEFVNNIVSNAMTDNNMYFNKLYNKLEEQRTVINDIVTEINNLQSEVQHNADNIQTINEYNLFSSTQTGKKMDDVREIYDKVSGLLDNTEKIQYLETKLTEYDKIKQTLDIIQKDMMQHNKIVNDRLKTLENNLLPTICDESKCGGNKNMSSYYSEKYSSILGKDELITNIIKKYSYTEQLDLKLAGLESKRNSKNKDAVDSFERGLRAKSNKFLRDIDFKIKEEKRKRFFGKLNDIEILDHYNEIPDNNKVFALSIRGKQPNDLKYGNYSFYAYCSELPSKLYETDIVDIRYVDDIKCISDLNDLYVVMEMCNKKNKALDEINFIFMYNEFLLSLDKYIHFLKEMKKKLYVLYNKHNVSGATEIANDRKQRNVIMHRKYERVLNLSKKISMDNGLDESYTIGRIYRYAFKFLRINVPKKIYKDKDSYLTYVFEKSKEKTISVDISNNLYGSYSIYFFTEELPSNKNEIDRVNVTTLEEPDHVDYISKVKDIDYIFSGKKEFELLKNFFIYKNEMYLYKKKIYDIKKKLLHLQEEIYKILISNTNDYENIQKFKILKDECIKLAEERKNINKEFHSIKRYKRKKDELVFLHDLRIPYNENRYSHLISGQLKELTEKTKK